MGERRISLLVTSADLVRPAGGEVVSAGNLRFHVESVDGLKVITWTDNGLAHSTGRALAPSLRFRVVRARERVSGDSRSGAIYPIMSERRSERAGPPPTGSCG